jgi:hypothetical protein
LFHVLPGSLLPIIALDYLPDARSFTALDLPTLGTRLAWTNHSPSTGTIAVFQTVNLNSTNITAVVSGNQITFSWPADHIRWILQTNSVNVVDPTQWFNLPGSDTTNQVVLPIDPAASNVFYRMVHSNP